MQFLRPDFEFENLFPTNDPDIEFYETHLREFGYDNDFITIILEHTPLFDSSFLYTVHSLSQQLSTIEGVVKTQSPTEIKQPLVGPMGMLYLPLLHLDNNEKLEADSVRIFTHPLYDGFFGKNRNSLILNITHEHFTQPEQGDAFIAAVQKQLNDNKLKARLVGKLTAQKTFIELIGKDFGKFIALGLGLSLILLLLIFRSFRSALLPYLISISALIWLMGLMGMLGIKLSILSSLIPPIILFASTSDAIHLVNAYKKSAGEKPNNRAYLALSHVFVPTFLTSITTAIGFFSLYTLGTKPVQEFGLFAGIGILIAFVITMFIGPLLTYGWETNEITTSRYRGYVVWLLSYPKAFFILTLLMLLLGIEGFVKMNTDAYLLGDLPKNNTTRQDFQCLEDQYGGYKPYEIAFWPTNENNTIWDEEVAYEAAKIDRLLLENFGLRRSFSPISLIKMGNQMNQGGQNDAFEMPDKANYKKVLRSLRPIIAKDSTVQNTANPYGGYARIVGFIPEWGSKRTMQKKAELSDRLRKAINPEILQYRITGTTYLIDKSHHQLSKNLLNGLLIAILTVSLVLGVYFKSLKLLIISLIPNLIPLILVAGTMGWLGITLQLTTAIIFAASFGIAVDDTIHFIAVYRGQTSKNKVIRLTKTFDQAGNAILITSVILIGGFSLFLFSSFGATYYLGLFLCLSLSFAVIIDMTLLPLILNYFNKSDKT